MNNKGVVFFDVDGTLIDWPKKIYEPTKATKESINKLKGNGYLTILATGRPMSSVDKGLLSLGLDGYIASNGAYAEIHNEVIVNEPINNEELKEVLRYLDDNEIIYLLEGQEKIYVKDIKNEAVKKVINRVKLDRDTFSEDWNEDTVKIGKIIAVSYNEDSFEIVVEKFKEKGYAFMRNLSNGNLFEIYKAKYSKGYGVKKLLDAVNIDKANAYAFGDGENDIEMFQEVKYGIAMGECHKRLEPYAYDFTENVENEGITEALKKYKLI
ncbi:MAG: HAD family hydrolase [Clostridium sp.]|nr:HAD family hydrolase [Clostridium sp.]